MDNKKSKWDVIFGKLFIGDINKSLFFYKIFILIEDCEVFFLYYIFKYNLKLVFLFLKMSMN